MDNNLKLPVEMLEPMILSYSLRNISFFLKVKQYIDTRNFKNKSYFNDEKYQDIFNLICAFFDFKKKFPRKATLLAMLEKQEKDEDLKILKRAIIRKIFEDVDYEIDEEYLESEVLNFIKETKVYEAILESQSDIQNKNFSTITKRMENAVRINFDKDLGVSLTDSDLGLEKIRSLNKEKALPVSGFSHLNNFIDGGFHPKEIYCFAGIPGSGKCSRHDSIIDIEYEINEEGKIL